MAKNDSHLSQGAPVKDAPIPQHKRIACGEKGADGTSNPNGGDAPKGKIGNAKVNY